MLFSILVPVFNVEDYLEECVESVLKQSYTNYELLLIDDGSTDSSGVICDEYAKSDSRIKVFHKHNEGQLLTRRYAIEKSQGQYILFLDSDDMWMQGLLQMVYDTIVEFNADMVLYWFMRVDDDGHFVEEPNKPFKDYSIFTKENELSIFSEIAKGANLNSLCTKAVSREIIDFTTDYSECRVTVGEDLLQSLEFFRNAEKIVYRDTAYYLYRQRVNSVTRRFSPQYIVDRDYVRHAVYECLCEMGYDTPANQKAFFMYYLSHVVLDHVIMLSTSTIPYGETKKYLDFMRDMDFYHRAIAMKSYSHLPFRKAIVFLMFHNKLDRPLMHVIRAMHTISQHFLKPSQSAGVSNKGK